MKEIQGIMRMKGCWAYMKNFIKNIGILHSAAGNCLSFVINSGSH